MFDLVQVDSEWRISSLELLELINQIRVAEGLNKMMPSRFNRKVRDELEGDNLRWQKKVSGDKSTTYKRDRILRTHWRPGFTGRNARIQAR